MNIYEDLEIADRVELALGYVLKQIPVPSDLEELIPTEVMQNINACKEGMKDA